MSDATLTSPPNAGRRPTRQQKLAGQIVAALLFLAVMFTLYAAAGFFMPVVLAILLALIFQPVVSGLRRVGIPAYVSATFVICALFGSGWYAVSALAEPAREWVAQAPATFARIEQKVRALKKPIEDAGRAAEQVQKLAETPASPAAPKVQTVALKPEGLGLRMINGTVDAITAIVSVAFLMLFLLATEGRLLAKVGNFISHTTNRDKSSELLAEIERQVSRCLALTTLINIGLGILVGLALWAIGLPHPVMWGIAVTLLNYVPYLGGAVGTALVAIAGFIAFDDPVHILAPPLAYIILNTIEGMVVTPMVLGRQFSVDSCFVFVWLMYWSWSWGVAGAVLAMPMLTALKIVCSRVPELEPLNRLIAADEPAEPRTAVGRMHRRLLRPRGLAAAGR